MVKGQGLKLCNMNLLTYLNAISFSNRSIKDDSSRSSISTSKLPCKLVINSYVGDNIDTKNNVYAAIMITQQCNT